MKKNILVAVSGGRSSAYMAYHIHTSKKYADYQKLYTFANTGMEHPKTIEFLKDIEKHWGIDIVKVEGVYSEIMGVGVNYKIVDYDNLDMNSTPFSAAIVHMNKGEFSGLPHKDAPYCSGRLKVIPCEKLANDVFGVGNYVKAIGYRKEDMPKRITWPEIKADQKRIFPLFTDFKAPISVYDLYLFFRTQPFKLDIPKHLGNCILCWKKSDDNLAKALSDESGKKFIEWWANMENTYGNVSFRNNRSIYDLVKIADLKNKQTSFDLFSDEDESCSCSF
jgi:hypothetical protein